MCDFLKSIESNFAQVNNFNRKSDIYAIHSHFQSVITDRCFNSRCSAHEHRAAVVRASQREPWSRPLSSMRSEITLRSNVTCSRKHSYAGKISTINSISPMIRIFRTMVVLLNQGWFLNLTCIKWPPGH